MPKLLQTKLDLQRCPHCNIDTPNLKFLTSYLPTNIEAKQFFWRTYLCARCAGVVTATAPNFDLEVTAYFPSGLDLSSDLPERPRAYLEQAMNSLNAPAGAVMLAASAVDAMLKAKGFSSGSLYARIEEAVENHLITSEMAQWAHEVRLDANDQRHSDEDAPLPSIDQAKKCLDFALALGQFLFVLPAKVQRGLVNAKSV